MMPDPGLSTSTMDQTTLGEHLHELNQRMIYVFDFFSNRAFFIELIESSDETSSRDTPFIAHSRGEAPPQLALDRLLDDEQDLLLDEDGNGDKEDLNLDDLDPDMLDEGMPEDY